MTTRPTAADVIDSVLPPVMLPSYRNAILAALEQAGIRTYHEADARHGWMRDSGYGDVVIFTKPLQFDQPVVVIPAEAES